MTGISFPGLGIDEFWVSPTAFTVFGKDIAWYGVIITCGILLAFLTARLRARYEKIDEDTFYDLGMITVLCGIVGARLYYVVFRGGYIVRGGDFWSNLKNSFVNIIAIWNGGLAIYGGILAGAAAIVVFCAVRRINMLKFLDTVAPSVILAQSIGRWGNFINGEAHGGETEIFCRMGIRFSEYANTYYYHPTFLYESLWNLVGFALLYSLYKKKKFNGQIVLCYFAWYGLGRLFIEGLRTDSLYVGDTGIRVSQLLAGVLFAVSLLLICVLRRLVDRIPALALTAPSGCEDKFAKEEALRAEKKAKKNPKTEEIKENEEKKDDDTGR